MRRIHGSREKFVRIPVSMDRLRPVATRPGRSPRRGRMLPEHSFDLAEWRESDSAKPITASASNRWDARARLVGSVEEDDRC